MIKQLRKIKRTDCPKTWAKTFNALPRTMQLLVIDKLVYEETFILVCKAHPDNLQIMLDSPVFDKNKIKNTSDPNVLRGQSILRTYLKSLKLANENYHRESTAQGLNQDYKNN